MKRTCIKKQDNREGDLERHQIKLRDTMNGRHGELDNEEEILGGRKSDRYMMACLGSKVVEKVCFGVVQELVHRIGADEVR